MTERTMRSWMFVPGNRDRFLAKAASSNADCVLLDLEDGVLPESKVQAREMVSAALHGEFRPMRFVRVNASGTPWHLDDLVSVIASKPDGICLPKCNTPKDVVELAARLDTLETVFGVVCGTTRIVGAIESPQGILNAPAIALADPRLLGLMLGAEDLALELGLGTAREAEAAQLIYPRSALVIACAAAAVVSIDGVYPNLDDASGMAEDALRARRLGFSAKSTFNPRQVAVINETFSPRAEELEYAEEVAWAFEEAERRGDASVAVRGQLVDRPIAMRARRLLERAQAGPGGGQG